MLEFEKYFGGILDGKIVACDKMKRISEILIEQYLTPGEFHFDSDIETGESSSSRSSVNSQVEKLENPCTWKSSNWLCIQLSHHSTVSDDYCKLSIHCIPYRLNLKKMSGVLRHAQEPGNYC